MKHIDFTNIGLGMELSPSFAKQNQEALLERLSALLKGLTNNSAGIVILDGCVMTKVGTQYDQTAGIVYYNGEILTVDAFSGNHATEVPVYQAPTNTFTQQAWYGDAILRDTFYTRKLPMAMAVAGSGIADYDDALRLNEESPWVDIVLINGWTTSAAPDSVAQYRIDRFRKVHLRGRISTPNPYNADWCNNLPKHPTKDIRQYIPHSAGNRLFTIPTGAGNVTFTTPGVHPETYFLDQCGYWID
jgi:hypothetical protein